MLGLAAVNTGNNLLYLLVAALLGLLIVSGVLGRANLIGLAAQLTLPEEIYAGVPTSAILSLTNRRRRARFLLTARLEGNNAHFSVIDPQAADEQSLSLNFAARGRRRIDGLRLSSPFPVGFFQRSAWLPLERDLIVLPHPVPCATPTSSQAQRSRGEAGTSRHGHDGDLLAVSDYSGREPLKLIHWKQSARHDAVKVKQLAATAARPLWVRLEDCPGATLEERLGNAVYLINLWWRSGRPLGLQIGAQTLAPGRGRRHRLRLLRELALYDAA
ncbi:Protein of unknown function DUF58 [Geoalkalibacter ferrihydriticus]|uniref:Uncharacterized protein n=1 Tax=Geoalkalibacter ferrihydriticus TaxID=392333 RepID=A0A1G9VPT0_9BACT|nr:DUF58 domain-containing protein [Geoalkalibacter ferrihydriticus]SDM73815.1 Protein of unknown function DUF58 [Geoalkalibacter ferrihydriticus]